MSHLSEKEIRESMDPVCDEFEAAWLRGERPSLNDIVQRVAPEIRSQLFTELLGIELELQFNQTGEVPGPEKYALHYPDFVAEIQATFREYCEREQRTRRLPKSAASTDDSSDGHAFGEAEFRRYLKPSARTGWLGRLGHYEIEAILGRGAFGIVAKALDEKLHRVVAIKLMHPDLAATSPPRQRFLREARSAAAVSHENIVAIYAVEEEPIPYLVMEYIPGQTLQQRMDEKGPLEAKDVLRIGQQVAAGMAAAHGTKLIHRDIKPANILLTGGPVERAKISDFGMARAVDDASMTQSGMIAGTPLYMAPEQARGEVLDHRADLFSLGSVLYQMASGRPPFRAANTMAVLKRVCDDTPRALNDVQPEIPGWLETIIFKLLEKKREDRYQTAQELADLLARCQWELEHNGYVTSVGRSPSANDTQVLPSGGKLDKRALRIPPGWLAAGAVVAAVIGFALKNGEKKTPDFDTSIPSIATTSSAPREAPSAKPPQTWHGWPSNAPAPAITPFDMTQAKTHQEAWAKYLGLPVEVTNSVGAKMILIPPGEFLMGAPDSDTDAAPHEKPQHLVRLTKPFAIAATEVNNRQFRQFVEATRYVTQAESDGQGAFGVSPKTRQPALVWNNSEFTKSDQDEFPARCVSWEDARRFCEWLSQTEGRVYRLPTEAEWEFACRAGTVTRYSFGNNLADTSSPPGSGGASLQPVAQLPANPFGLFDMHGNVNEICWDAGRTFTPEPVDDPLGSLLMNTHAVVKGGAVSSPPARLRSSHRYLTDARQFPEKDFATMLKGFRMVAEIGSPSGGKWPLLSEDHEWPEPGNPGAVVNNLAPPKRDLTPPHNDVSPPEDLPKLGANALGPEIATDGLSLWFHAPEDPESGSSRLVLWQSWRQSMNEPFGAPIRVEDSINHQPDYNLSDVTLSADGLVLSFCRTKNESGGNSDLWLSTRPSGDASWSEPISAGPGVNTKHGEWEPELSPNGLELFFHSSRPNENGGTDLWVSRRTNREAEFGFAENLGPAINTQDIEGGAALSGDGLTLMFHRFTSSGVGLWRATRKSLDAAFEAPQRVTIPLPADEQFISVSLAASGDELFGMHRSRTRTVIAMSRLKTAVAVAAEKNFALSVSPGVHVEMATLNLDPAAPHTIEAWVTPALTVRDNKHVFGWPGPASLFVRNEDSSWTFGLAHTDKFQFVHDPQPITPGRRFHVATVRTGQEFRLFVDGQRVARDREHQTPLRGQSTPFSLSVASAKAAFSGDYDEVRVSSVARYDENFTPETRFEPDADTLALYHCDENGGEQLLDLSGNNHHGQIIGRATWIDAVPSRQGVTP